MRTKSHFTMIELMLALGVCVIGICGVMVLFPIGANASRDAAMETYAANAADQMLNYLRYRMQYSSTDWDGTLTHLTNNNPRNQGSYASASENLTSNWSSVGSEMPSCFYHSSPSLPGVYQLLSWRDSGTPDVNKPENIEFRSILNVWYENTDLAGVNERFAVRLNAEVCWPAELPSAARQKKTYSLEIFNPNYLQ
jgi:Tfp pilus assembly protein PilV